MNVTIETPRLIIRPWKERDAVDALFVWGDLEVCRFTGGAWDATTMRERVTRKLAEQARGKLCLQPIVEKSTDAIVGASGLQLLDGAPEVDIGWMLSLAAWGNGYATEMSQAVLRQGLQKLNLHRILATIDHRNKRSIAVVNCPGMRFWRVIRAYKRDMLCSKAAPHARR